MNDYQDSLDAFVETVFRLISDQLAEIARLQLEADHHGQPDGDNDQARV